MKPSLPLLLLLSLGAPACAMFSHQTPAEQAAMAECRQHADKVYLEQNPDAIYRADTYANGGRDAPNGGYGLMGVTGAGLGASYDRNQIYENCLVEKGVVPQPPVSQDVHPVAP
jgi:hypothetical protein